MSKQKQKPPPPPLRQKQKKCLNKYGFPESFIVEISSKHCLSQNRKSQGAEILRKCSPPITCTCQISCVTCLVSHVTSKVAYVTCNLNYIYIYILQSGAASCWRVCYQQGLPCLVNRLGVAGAVLQKSVLIIH